MPIELGGSRPSTPAVKLRDIGDKVIVHVVDVKEVPWIEYGTNDPKVGKDGKPRTQEVVTGLVVSGTGTIKDGDSERQVQAGDVVALYLAGHNRWEFVQARKTLGRPLNVGDVLQWRYDRDEKSAYGSPKKVRTVAIRPHKAEEADTVRRCEELHRQARTDGIALEQPAAAGAYDDPF